MPGIITTPPVIKYTPPAPATVAGRNTSGASVSATPQTHQTPGGVYGGGSMTPTQVRSMQQFLVNRGFNVAQDGVFGKSTQSAAQAFRADHKGGAAWSAKNGIGVHPASTPHGNAGDSAAAGTGAGSGTGTGTGTGSGTPGSDSFSQLLATLLKQGGNVGSMFDPKSFGNAAAAPSDALASTLARQAAANPAQERQNQSDISSWYGLDPKASSYKLSVLGRLGQAKTANATAATDASSNVADIAKQLASSIGGSANDGSGMVASAGADAAGTMSAVGQASTDYANAMDPLLAAEARGSMSKEHATNSTALLDLQDKLAQARGQATSDRATGVASATDKNNALGQQGFANKGNLLSILAQMQSANPDKNYLGNTLTQAKIDETNARTKAIISGKTGSGHVYKIDVAKSTQGIINHLGYAVNPSGQAVVPTSDHVRLAQTIGTFLRSQGFKPGDGEFKKIGDGIFAGFVDQHGRPLQAPSGWSI
jgi:hypothetical protein